MKNKNIEMIVVDGDGCLYHYNYGNYGSSWEVLGYAIKKEKEWEEILKKYISKPKMYKNWVKENVDLLKGKDVSLIKEYIFPIPYSKGAKETFKELNKYFITGILSSGVNLVVEKVKEELNMNFSISNIIYIENNKFNGKYKIEVYIDKKDKKLKKISKEYNIPLKKICFIGDNINDLPCLKIVGLPIAFDPKNKEIQKYTSYVIYDFKELFKILL